MLQKISWRELKDSLPWDKVLPTDISEKGFESRIYFKNSYTDTWARQRYYKKIIDHYPIQKLIEKSSKKNTSKPKQRIRRVVHYDQVGYTPGIQKGFNIQSMYYATIIGQGKKMIISTQKKNLTKVNMTKTWKKEKTLDTFDLEENFLNMIKATDEQTTPNITLNGVRWKTFP